MRARANPRWPWLNQPSGPPAARPQSRRAPSTSGRHLGGSGGGRRHRCVYSLDVATAIPPWSPGADAGASDKLDMRKGPPRRTAPSAVGGRGRRDYGRSRRGGRLPSSSTNLVRHARSAPLSGSSAHTTKHSSAGKSVYCSPFSKPQLREWRGRGDRLRPHSGLGSRAPNGDSWRCSRRASDRARQRRRPGWSTHAARPALPSRS
jgi:hypothetical protein